MEWQIRSLSKKSSGNGEDIKAGDTVLCLVYIDEFGNLERKDFKKSEFDNENEILSEIKYLGKWERIVSENPDEDERQAKRIALASSEDFFISLYDENGVEAEEKEVIKQMLALFLERKRILKAIGRPEGGVQKYLHTQSKREFLVLQKSVDEDLIMKIQTQLGTLMI